MDATQLSRRLETVAQFVPHNARLADIGSDHAYLPVHLALNKQIEMAIAGEVADGPFQNACHEINNRKLNEIIIPRLADGLAAVELADRIDTITIAGMGGALITEILDAGQDKLTDVSLLILQPNIGEAGLRKWLMEHSYAITAEKIVAEDQQIYEIIVAQPNGHQINYSESELLFGPQLIQEKTDVFITKWQLERDHLQQALTQMETAKQLPIEKIASFKREINLIEEVLK